MSRTLEQQAVDLDVVMAELVKKYQFRDRNETVSHGLSVSQAYALRALDEAGAATMGELAAALRLSVSAMTRVVDQLVARHLVARRRDEADRRICQVSMTKKGAALWQRVHEGLVGSEREVLRGIASDERELVIRVIGELSRAIDRWRSEQPG